MTAFWTFVTKEWYFFWPLFLMSLTAMTLVIWRLMLNHNSNTNMNLFLPQFQDILKKQGVEAALKFCRSQPTGLIPKKLFTSGLETAKQGSAAMRRAMANTIELEILPELNYLLPTILSIGKIATMVGLLLTVVSMINTFTAIQVISEQGGGAGIAGYTGAIGLALFATAFGLVTAIPLQFMHVQFKAWIAKFENKMKNAAQKLILLCQDDKKDEKK